MQSEKSKISNVLQKVNVAELEGSPLRGKKRMITSNYGNLLGFSQAETIMRTYNDVPNTSDFSPKAQLNASESINFPLIYPELASFFPEQREDFAKMSVFEKYKDIKTDHLIAVTKCNNGKHALAYYEFGKLKIATYVSIGKNSHKTLCGKYELTHDAVFRRSRKYKNAAMPYALQISGGYFLHQGRSNGSPQSHGCIRVPGLYQRWLYYRLPKAISGNDSKKKGAPTIVLEGLYP